MKSFSRRPTDGKAIVGERGKTMLDIFYIGVVIVFLGLMWGFTRAAENL